MRMHEVHGRFLTAAILVGLSDFVQVAYRTWAAALGHQGLLS